MALVGLVLLVLAGATLGRHVVDGGFYYDDWVNAATYEFDGGDTFFGGAGAIADKVGGRHVLAVVLAVPHALFGMNASLHIGLAVALSISACLVFYAVLRTLGIDSRDGVVIAALALLFPWSDSVRLWATGGMNNVAVCLCGAALLLTLRALRTPFSCSWRLHVASAVLYVGAVLTYEAVAPVVAVSLVLYAIQGPLGRAFRRWAIDASLAGGALAFNVALSERTAPPLIAIPSNVREFTEQFLSLFTSAVVPVSGETRASVAVFVFLTAVIATAVYSAVRESRGRRRLDYWLVVAVVALTVTAAAYSPYLASGLFPRSVGLNNRINIVASFAIVTLVYAAIKLVARWIALTRLGGRIPANMIASAAVVVIAIGYAIETVEDARLWDTAAARQARIVSAVTRQPAVTSGHAVFTFGHEAEIAPGVPVFLDGQDLSAAVQVTRRDRTIRAYPVYRHAVFVCGTSALVPKRLPDSYTGSEETGTDIEFPFGAVLFVDVRTGRFELVDDRASCRSALRRFGPGDPPSLHDLPVPSWTAL